MISGSILLDLTNVEPARLRWRVATVDLAPAGVLVILVVGPLPVEPDVVRILRDHTDRLSIEVQGEPYAVQRWVEVLRTGRMPGELF